MPTYNANTLAICCASGKSSNSRLAKVLFIFYTFNVVFFVPYYTCLKMTTSADLEMKKYFGSCQWQH